MIDRNEDLALAPDAVLQVVDGEALFLKLQDESVFALNETGARVAQLIVQGLALGPIVETLSDEYDASRAEVEREVYQLVNELVLRELLIGRP